MLSNTQAHGAPSHPAVLETPGQEHALDHRAAEAHARFAPVPLHVLARQPLETDHRRGAGLELRAEPGDEAIEGGGTPHVGRRRILPGQLEHPGRGNVRLVPAQQCLASCVQRPGPPPSSRRVRRLAEYPRDRVAVTAHGPGDPGVELPLLLQELDRAACHGCKHPPCLHEGNRSSRRRCPSRWRIPEEKSWRK